MACVFGLSNPAGTLADSAVRDTRARPARGAKKSLLDDVVGERQQPVGDGDPERLRGLEIDDKLELARLHHRKFARLLALEHASGINAGLAKRLSQIVAVTHQTTRLGGFAERIDRRNTLAG